MDVLHTEKRIEKSLKIVWPMIFLVGVIGFLLGWLVLSGDQLGRVNLFYLLLVYLLLPILSIVVSIISLIFGKGFNLARLISLIPIWSFQTKDLIRKIQQFNLDKSWFLMQSQAAAIAFSLASLMIYFVLLLATDINFVWRSTILEPVDIFPLLEVVARPWSFWTAAQPNIDLLEATRDFRMITSVNQMSDYGAWWKFILATQLCYSLLLRLLLIMFSRWWIRRSLKVDIERALQQQISQHQPVKNKKIQSSPVVHQIPELLVISNWDAVPVKILALLPELDLSVDNIMFDGWYNVVDQNKILEKCKEDQLLIVKAWEPPMGELEDYMQKGQGYLLPLDWDESGLKKIELNHFREWQRLINKLSGWQLYVPGDRVVE